MYAAADSDTTNSSILLTVGSGASAAMFAIPMLGEAPDGDYASTLTTAPAVFAEPAYLEPRASLHGSPGVGTAATYSEIDDAPPVSESAYDHVDLGGQVAPVAYAEIADALVDESAYDQVNFGADLQADVEGGVEVDGQPVRTRPRIKPLHVCVCVSVCAGHVTGVGFVEHPC